ncbi:MAG: hypothetical protein AAF849_20445 [Bacteroidota bacterium]
MKNSILSLLMISSCFASFSAYAQSASGNLMMIIERTNEEQLVLEYPESTTYEITDQASKKASAIQEEKGMVYEKGVYKITVFPTYKESPDHYEIAAEQIHVLRIENHNDPIELHQKVEATFDYGRYNGAVKIDKLLVKSKQYPDEYNCIVSLSNGIVFSYIDRKVAATLGDKILSIEGKYIIDSELGVAKISFNPKDGQVWYVFEEKVEKELVQKF